ncbi:hypothetical protein B0H17DRAFT_1207643 [Mycena rosella]|uniref:Uncharacterized protein n=1 Tax=Mycena rosella TaxID=1033263 RepID=A0AAD7D684_MYCRO|nr:hypothetical protein B0H17DRAFT_1207643 [Mycena rosella]
MSDAWHGRTQSHIFRFSPLRAKLTSPSAAAPNTSLRAPERRVEPPTHKILQHALGAVAKSSESDTRSLKKALEAARTELEKTRATAENYQAQLTCRILELKGFKKDQELLKRQIAALQEAEETRPRLVDPEARQRKPQSDIAPPRELEKRNQQLEQELTVSRDVVEKLRSELHALSESVAKRDRRIQDLEQENGVLGGQLKILHKGGKGKGREDPLIDIFNHQLDQVSEAHIKSEVECLNDSLDTLVMEITEQGDQLAAKHSNHARNFPNSTHPRDPLFNSLAQPNLTDENRGLLLDVMLHEHLLSQLFDLFFFGDVASLPVDPEANFQVTIEEMAHREPWTVVQRWRAITAATVFNLYDQPQFEANFVNSDKTIVTLLARAYGLSLSEFEPIADMVRSKLHALYKEAKKLCITVRRDILSVRMSVVTVTDSEAHFDPDCADSVWPEMGAAKGDKVVGRYRFGLMKLDEHGRVSYLIKPEVATTALIRETSKNG